MSEAVEALTALLDALEAGIVQARNILAGPSEAWNPNEIKWENKQGSKGPFERSEDLNNPHHKALVKDLAAHNGKLTRDGLFYWLFQNGSTVGRKKARFTKTT